MVFNPQREEAAIARILAQGRKLNIALAVITPLIIALAIAVVWLIVLVNQNPSYDYPSPPPRFPNLDILYFQAKTPSTWFYGILMSYPSLLLDPLHISPLYNSTTGRDPHFSLLGNFVALAPTDNLSGDLVLNMTNPTFDQARVVLGVQGVLKKDGVRVSWICSVDFHNFTPFSKCSLSHFATSNDVWNVSRVK